MMKMTPRSTPRPLQLIWKSRLQHPHKLRRWKFAIRFPPKSRHLCLAPTWFPRHSRKVPLSQLRLWMFALRVPPKPRHLCHRHLCLLPGCSPATAERSRYRSFADGCLPSESHQSPGTCASRGDEYQLAGCSPATGDDPC